VEVNTNINPQDFYTVYIPHFFSLTAVANGTASNFKPVELHIIVCGWEVITNNGAEINEELVINFDRLRFLESYEGQNMFSTNDTDCPAIDFSLKVETGNPDTAANPPAGTE